VDSSLPVLVSRLPDKRALTRLVRAALRHEVAQVDLTHGPQKAEAHTLDLHVAGEPPLALLAEPAGAPRNGRFPLRLRPLYRAQAAQLHAFLEAENVALDGPPDIAKPDTKPPDTAKLENTLAISAPPVSTADAPPLAPAMSGAAPPPIAVMAIPQSTGVEPLSSSTNRAGADARRTAPGATWGVIQDAPSAPGPNETIDSRQHVPKRHHLLPSVIVAEGVPHEHEADIEDASLSVSVVFEPNEVPDAVKAMAAEVLGSDTAPATEPPVQPPSGAPAADRPAESEAQWDSPADVEEPSLSVSVVFEPDALPPAVLAGVPSPLGDAATGAARPPVQLEPRGLADSFADVSVDEVELVDSGHGDSEPKLPARPVASSALAPSSYADDDDDDDNDTLVRVVPPPDPRRQPPERVVHPEARDKSEFTPTQQPPQALERSKTSTGGGRKKKTTRRSAATPAVTPRQTSADTDAPGALAPDEEDTAAMSKPPVASPSPAPPPDAEEAPSSKFQRADDPAIGRRVAEGKYIIESLIGSGAAGSVYRATHRELRRTVAIKLLHPHYQQDPHFMTSFRGEALAASQLDHPNVMRVLDFGQEPDGLVYIVMEFLSGRTLQSLLDEERRLPMDRAVEIMIQVCAALSVAHDNGIIHRDIKPDNIMLVPSRNDEGASFELVKVCDFGIAALQNQRAKEDADLAALEHVIAGTPEYMSPEQARGRNIDARSDVYACGICLYELVTGRPPFIGDNPGEILIKQLEEIPKPPSQIIKNLDPIIEEIILRAVQKDPEMRHQSAREMRVELKELIAPAEEYDDDDQDERSIVENVPVLDDPASGFPGFFIAFASALLRFGRFERGHNETVQAMKELQKAVRKALRGRNELTFARRDVQKTISFVVMTGSAEIVDLRRLLGSQLYGSFGHPFTGQLVAKGVASLTLREGIPETELQSLIDILLGPSSGEDLRKTLLAKPLRDVSVLFVTDVVGRDRKLAWKVGLGASRLSRDLRALANVRGISLKKMRETRDELVAGVARLLTRGDEVKQFIFNADLVDEAVANLRGFSSFKVAPLIIDRVLNESCAETAMLLLSDYDDLGLAVPRDTRHAAYDSSTGDEAETLRTFLRVFAQRLITERSPKSDAAVAELYRRKLISEEEMPRDLKEAIRAQTLADALVREPSQFLRALELVGDPETYAMELSTLEAAMATLARRGDAVALLAVMSTLARHARGSGKPGPRETAALRTMKSMIDQQRLLPIATALLSGPANQHEAARQLIVLAGSVGVATLYAAREATTEPSARATFVKVFRETGAAGWALLSQVLPQLQGRDDAELTLIEDLLRAMPERADPTLGEAVSRFLAHPLLRPTALAAIVPLWGDRARKPLVEALEYAEEPTRLIALRELRRLRAIDEYVVSVIERFLTMRGFAGDDLRAASAAALADVQAPLRVRAVQLLSKAVEGKRGIVAMLRGSDGDESVVVMEAMGGALLALDRQEGMRALKARLVRSEGLMRQRLTALLRSS
jgi:serine/threonine-protein kinase